MQNPTAIALALTALVALTACDAMQNFGDGVEQTGQRIERKAEQAERESQQNHD